MREKFLKCRNEHGDHVWVNVKNIWMLWPSDYSPDRYCIFYAAGNESGSATCDMEEAHQCIELII